MVVIESIPSTGKSSNSSSSSSAARFCCSDGDSCAFSFEVCAAAAVFDMALLGRISAPAGSRCVVLYAWE